MCRERGLIFSAPMVLALLAGRKTQTRRIVKLKPYQESKAAKEHWEWKGDDMLACCPYGVVGDRLWVRETFSACVTAIDDMIIRYAANEAPWYLGVCDVPDSAASSYFRMIDKSAKKKGKSIKYPSIFMPRWASRITLEITGVRVERLQDISEADCKAEGIPEPKDHYARSVPNYWREGYQILWDSLHGKGAWDANPFVWVLTFKKAGDNG